MRYENFVTEGRLNLSWLRISLLKSTLNLIGRQYIQNF